MIYHDENSTYRRKKEELKLPWEGVCLTNAQGIYSTPCPLRLCPPYNEYQNITLEK